VQTVGIRRAGEKAFKKTCNIFLIERKALIADGTCIDSWYIGRKRFIKENP
jgi:hypothetical protein